jgi:hypothetical protein
LGKREGPKNILRLKNAGPIMRFDIEPRNRPLGNSRGRSVDTGDHARATFEAPGELHLHLASVFIEGIEVGGAGIETEAFRAFLIDGLIRGDIN